MAHHQLALDVAALDGPHHAALFIYAGHLRLGAPDERLHFSLDHRGAVEQVAVFEQVGFQCQHLLHAQRPLLVPGPWQAQCLVPGGQLNCAGPRVFRQGDRQHFQHDALYVVFRL